MAGLRASVCKLAHVQSRNIDTMLEPATAPWGLRISDSDYGKLSAGLEPQDMDDKWRVRVIDLSESATTAVHFSRSWTDQEYYVLVLKPIDRAAAAAVTTTTSGGGGMEIEALIWEQDKGGIHMTEELAKIEVILVSRSILGCDFEALPDYDSSSLENHPSARLDAD